MKTKQVRYTEIKSRLNNDYFNIGLAIVSCFIFTFAIYSELYHNGGGIWARLSITGLIFYFFYVFTLKNEKEKIY